MPKKTDTQEPNIVRYQTKSKEFEYARFWDSRSYEDSAERLLLNRWLKAYPEPASRLVDIGGSFGRLLPTYAQRFKSVSILDYATNEFHLAKQVAADNYLDIQFVAANAYHLPLADNSQPAVIAIRIVHHLEEPDKFFAEVNRVLTPGGVAIIEVANKNHLKLLFSMVRRRSFKDWRLDHTDTGSSGVQADRGFLLLRAYKPAYIESIIESADLRIVKRRSVSWLRRTSLANLPRPIVSSIERLGQLVSPLFMIAPSSWYLLTKQGTLKDQPEGEFVSTLVHPPDNRKITKGSMRSYQKQTKRGVNYLDLRYPPFL